MLVNTEKKRLNVLVVEPDYQTTRYINEQLSDRYCVMQANSAESAYPVLLKEDIAVMLCSEYLPGENGLIFMARMNREFPKTQPVLMSEGVTEDLLAFAINDVGVLKYLKKPLCTKPLLDAISGASEHYIKAMENETLQHNYTAIIKQTQSLPYIAKRIQESTPVILSNIGTSATAASGTLLLLLALILIFGSAVILAIYSFKSLLGIDLFNSIHFTDLFN